MLTLHVLICDLNAKRSLWQRKFPLLSLQSFATARVTRPGVRIVGLMCTNDKGLGCSLDTVYGGVSC